MSEAGRGLYRKYTVERTDGGSEPGGKHGRCKYFVLDLTHDEAAPAALRAYARACKKKFPKLALDLEALALGNRAPLRKLNVFGSRSGPGYGR